MKPFIPTSFYAVIHYLGAILLICSPWAFDFIDSGSTAAYYIPVVMGVLLLLIAIFSDNKLGLIKIFPMQMNLFLAMFAGFLLIVGPSLYSFASKVWVPHFSLGAMFFVFAIFTKNSPYTTQPHEMLKESGITSTDSLEGRLMV